MVDKKQSELSDSVQYRRNILLRAIRQAGEISRRDLAGQVQMSNSRVCDLVQEILDEGLLVEESPGPERRGRRGVPVRVNASHGCIVGFDMEALRLRIVACDFAGKVLWQKQEKLALPRSKKTLINRILKFIEKGLGEISACCGKILGIGLAGAGVIDIDRGVILHYDMLPCAIDVPLRDLVADATSLPCWMDVNIGALTLAERTSGAGEGLDNFLCYAVRSGIGACLVIDGKVLRGSHGRAGEAGYAVVPTSGCSSQWKRLQMVVSERALKVDAEDAAATIPPAQARKAGELIGGQLASLAALLDPQAIILAGELVQPGSAIYDSMCQTYQRFLLPELADRVPLLPAALGPFAAAIGAAHGCFEMLYPVERNQRSV